MKGGSKVKAILVMVILLLVGILAVVGVGAVKTYMSGAAGDEAPTEIVATPTDDCRGVLLTFKTAVEVQPIIMYGAQPNSLLLIKTGEAKTTEHKILITPLKIDSAVYYKIKIKDMISDNGGVAYSAKTCASASTTSEDTTAETSPMSPDGSVPDSVPTTVLVPSTVPAATGTTTATTGSGECNKTNDYDGDGTVTTFDYYFCLKGVPTPTTKVLDACFNVDFNKDGVINAIDRIQCLQSKGN